MIQHGVSYPFVDKDHKKRQRQKEIFKYEPVINSDKPINRRVQSHVGKFINTETCSPFVAYKNHLKQEERLEA